MLRAFYFSLASGASYLIVSLILGLIPVNFLDDEDTYELIFINTNGIHLDIILSKEQISPQFLNSLQLSTDQTSYISFGWGDRDFYLNTPTWSDLKFSTAVKAMFLKSETLMHVTQHGLRGENWTPVHISQVQLAKLLAGINNSFKEDSSSRKLLLREKGYGSSDEFYEARGSYSCLKTCNTWVNSMFKNAGIKACLWTPFDFALLRLHKN